MKRNNRGGKTPLYQIWYNMLQRCTNPKHPWYHRYGGRGIRVCDRWKVFENFLDDIGEKRVGLSFDRINNDGNYTSENTTWSSQKQQTRNSASAKPLAYRGETHPLVVWTERLGLNYQMVKQRVLDGWPIEKAFETPKMGKSVPRLWKRKNNAIL